MGFRHSALTGPRRLDPGDSRLLYMHAQKCVAPPPAFLRKPQPTPAQLHPVPARRPDFLGSHRQHSRALLVR